MVSYLNKGGIIKKDIDYVLKNWENNTCDLWEEI